MTDGEAKTERFFVHHNWKILLVIRIILIGLT